jgi:hypothetical protein
MHYNVEANEICLGYFSLYLKKPVPVDTGKLIKLLSEVVA